MAGVFEIGTSMTRVGGKLQGKKGYTSSFFSGVLTTLIATPCSGPFLGAAMSYTLAQTAFTAMFLFTIFALGISTPYLLLSFFPALINKMPKPGAWMETFKVTMAFALFAVVAFFMQAFGGQTGVSGLSWLAMALVVIGLAAYFYGKWSPPYIKPAKRYLVRLHDVGHHCWRGNLDVFRRGQSAIRVWIVPKDWRAGLAKLESRQDRVYVGQEKADDLGGLYGRLVTDLQSKREACLL